MATAEKNKTSKETTSKCANPGCQCPLRPGEKYCSDYCESMAGAEACACGHRECEKQTGE